MNSNKLVELTTNYKLIVEDFLFRRLYRISTAMKRQTMFELKQRYVKFGECFRPFLLEYSFLLTESYHTCLAKEVPLSMGSLPATYSQFLGRRIRIFESSSELVGRLNVAVIERDTNFTVKCRHIQQLINADETK